MFMKKNKRGMWEGMTDKVLGFIMIIILVVVLVAVAAGLLPTAGSSLNTLKNTQVNDSGTLVNLPLNTIFAANGVVMLIIMVGLLLAIIVAVFALVKKDR